MAGKCVGGYRRGIEIDSQVLPGERGLRGGVCRVADAGSVPRLVRDCCHERIP